MNSEAWHLCVVAETGRLKVYRLTKQSCNQKLKPRDENLRSAFAHLFNAGPKLNSYMHIVQRNG